MMSEFRRWKGENLKPDWRAVRQRLVTLLLWLSGGLSAVVLVWLMMMYG